MGNGYAIKPKKGYPFSSLFVNLKSALSFFHFSSLCYSFHMPLTREILEEKQMNLFSSLASTVLSLSYSPIVGARARKELEDAVKEEEGKAEWRKSVLESRERRDKISSALESAEEKKSAISLELEGKYRALGEILCEENSKGTLDPCIGFIDEGDRRGIRKAILSAFSKEGGKRFAEYGKKLFEDRLEDIFISYQASSLISEISKLRLQYSSQEEKAVMLKRKLDSAEFIRTYEEDDEDRAEKLRISYGAYLFENGHKWIDENTPEPLLDIVSALLENEEKIAEEKEKEKAEENLGKAQDIDALISDNLMKIDALEAEKAKLDAKINDLRFEIKSLEEEKNGILKGSF